MGKDQFIEVAEKLEEYCQENNYTDLDNCFRVIVLPRRYIRLTMKDAVGRFAELAKSECPDPVTPQILDEKKNGLLVIETSLVEGKWEIEYSFEKEK